MSSTFANVKSYVEYLGAFWNAFNGLEMMLRIYLTRLNGIGTADLLQMIHAAEGETLPKSPMTDWSTFRTLCSDFNKSVLPASQIDFDDINALRDAMVHGRVTGDEQGQMVVVKFSKPSNGMVNVEFKRVLTVQFLDSMTERMIIYTRSISSHIAPHMKP